MPAQLVDALHRASYGGRIMHLSPALAEMETRAAHANRVQTLQLAVAKLVAYDADSTEVLAFIWGQGAELVDQQAVVDVVALRVDDHSALEAHGTQHLADV